MIVTPLLQPQFPFCEISGMGESLSLLHKQARRGSNFITPWKSFVLHNARKYTLDCIPGGGGGVLWVCTTSTECSHWGQEQRTDLTFRLSA